MMKPCACVREMSRPVFLARVKTSASHCSIQYHLRGVFSSTNGWPTSSGPTPMTSRSTPRASLHASSSTAEGSLFFSAAISSVE